MIVLEMLTDKSFGSTIISSIQHPRDATRGLGNPIDHANTITMATLFVTNLVS